jgi:CheY-like chemotaxis protein
MKNGKLKILCVDDEPRVLQGLDRSLREDFEVMTAPSGAAGLDILSEHKDLAIVISDMRMPEMDGAVFLSHATRFVPNAVRILLTGYSDMNAAMKAVNEGQIFRLLTKPCPPDVMMGTMQTAVRQYELVTAEKVLLQQTLLGAIKALVDVVSLANPVAFGRASRLKQRVARLAVDLQLDNRWAVEVAALLSQLSMLPLSDVIVQKVVDGEQLSDEETAWVSEGRGAVVKLLERIPRMERVVEVLQGAYAADNDVLCIPAQVLKICIELDALEERGHRGKAALDLLRAKSNAYDAGVLDALSRSIGGSAESVTKEATPEQLRLGMVLAEDLRSAKGVLLAPRGCEVTTSFMAHIKRFEGQLEKSSILVSARM